MFPVFSGRRVMILAGVTLAVVLLASPSHAQTTGIVKGRVVDVKGQPVEGAKVTIEFKEGITRRYVVPTSKKGEYIQVGLTPGQYKVTAEKDKLAQSFDARVRIGDTTEVNFQLTAAAAGAVSKEAAEKSAKIKALFDEGVAASTAGDYDGAIVKYTDALALLPECYECHYNIALAYTQKKDYVKAEEAIKKSIEIKPDYVEAYNALAAVYNAQRKFAEARDASTKAGELAAAAAAATPGGAPSAGNIDVLYNQGVIAWNAGSIEEAQKKFEEVLKVNPNHADSHYQLGMTLVNQGKLPEAAAEFEAYLKLAPSGQYAAQAQAIVKTLKK